MHISELINVTKIQKSIEEINIWGFKDPIIFFSNRRETCDGLTIMLSACEEQTIVRMNALSFLLEEIIGCKVFIVLASTLSDETKKLSLLNSLPFNTDNCSLIILLYHGINLNKSELRASLSKYTAMREMVDRCKSQLLKSVNQPHIILHTPPIQHNFFKQPPQLSDSSINEESKKRKVLTKDNNLQSALTNIQEDAQKLMERAAQLSVEDQQRLWLWLDNQKQQIYKSTAHKH